MKKSDIDKNIKLTYYPYGSIDSIEYFSILYTNIPYRIPNNHRKTSADDTTKYYKDNFSKEKQKEIFRQLSDIQNMHDDIENRWSIISYDDDIFEKTMKDYSDKIETLSPYSPKRLRNLKKDDLVSDLQGYFVTDYNEIFFDCYKIFIDFLNCNLDDFNDYLVFFTTFFIEIIDFIDEKDLENLDCGKIINPNIIIDLAQKYYSIIKKEIVPVQKLFKDFIDYIYIQKSKYPLLIQQKFFIFYTKYKQELQKYAQDYISTNWFSFNYSGYAYLKNAEFKPISDIEKYIYQFDIRRSFITNDFTLYTTSLFSFFYIFIYYLVFNSCGTIKKCKNCNKYFLTLDNTVCYCENIYMDFKTCRDVGVKLTQQKKELDNPVYGKYRKIYAKKAMLVKRNPDIAFYRTDYEQWKKDTKKFIVDIKKGTKNYEEFDEWLEKNK